MVVIATYAVPVSPVPARPQTTTIAARGDLAAGRG
jgi:hypothetical protein